MLRADWDAARCSRRLIVPEAEAAAGGDAAEDGGFAGAGGGGERAGAAVGGFVGEDGEGERFFGVAGDAVVLADLDREGGKFGGEQAAQGGVARAAAGEGNGFERDARQDEAAVGVGDRAG